MGSQGVGMLVLSLFPGIGLLDMAFEEEGFCVVRGPDLLWGGDIRRFHPPARKFDGVIGGPPCQAFSPLAQAARMGLNRLAEDLTPEFSRCIRAARPGWFLMENVVGAPLPDIDGYHIDSLVVNNRWFGAEQNRRRRFTFGSTRPLVNMKSARTHPATLANPWRRLEVVALEAVDVVPCVTASGTQWERDTIGKSGRKGRSRSDRSVKALVNYIRWQGLPDDFLSDAPCTVEGKVRMVGNGVPLPMGLAIARAVKSAILQTSEAT